MKKPFMALVFLGTGFAVASAQAFDVTTYHYDNQRSGWNLQETTLTAKGFPDGKSSKFGILSTVAGLDNQVDAQPLVITCSETTFKCKTPTDDVVYLATENNTVYAIDSPSGAILLQRNLGNPVTLVSRLTLGIRSTPVIDATSHTLYVIAYTCGSLSPCSPMTSSYQLHALDLSTLADKVFSPVTVGEPPGTASHTLTDSTTHYSFNAAVQRQVPALLEQADASGNVNVYVGFGSHGDTSGNETRGWVLGWNAKTLVPLAANQLNDTQATSPTNFFLSEIWMSGYGLAGAGSRIYFATGNSDCDFNHSLCPPMSTYDGKTNIQESVVRLEGDLTHISGIFTPSEPGQTLPQSVLTLDKGDTDVGSGGAMVVLLPPPANLEFVVAGGKDGRIFLLQPQSSGALILLQTKQLEGCWCGPSYFIGFDNIPRLVTSTGSTLRTWHIHSSSPHLTSPGGSATINASQQDPGFFTTVSSNGTATGSGIIWAVGRPHPVSTNPTAVTLYAFTATTPSANGILQQLFPINGESGSAGSWPGSKNANIVPVVANGKVYVASAYVDSSQKTRGQLNIFGIGGTGQPLASAVASLPSPHVVSGTLLTVSGSTLTLKTRKGKSATVDASQAIQNQQVGTPLNVGVPLTAQGKAIGANGALLATSIDRAKGDKGELWPEDK